jgi:transcriptional regulator with XRE-family HTH domain
MDALYGVHAGMTDDVRFVFESITGMQELWGGEDDILKFYAHSCPRLYELNTIAYWVLEKNAHSHRLRAQINQIAQVAIDLSVKRGTTSLTILKAEQRQMATLHKAVTYWTNDLGVSFQDDRRASGPLELGLRIKEARTKRGLSQTELAKLIGVTPSTISQIESNSIYPSLPALFKMAEVLSCEVGYFFHGRGGKTNHVFPSSKAIEVKIGNIPDGLLSARMLVPMDFDHKSEPYLIEVAPDSIINSHFFLHKGEEMGYLLSGKLHMTVGEVVQKLRPGDLVYITTDIPTRWFNPGPNSAKLLWMKMK